MSAKKKCCCNPECTGTCGETDCPCTVDDTGAEASTATCSTCPAPGHEYSVLGIRWRPTTISGIVLTVPEGGIAADSGDSEVSDLSAGAINTEILADEAGVYVGANVGRIQDDLPSTPVMSNAPAGPYAWLAGTSLEAATSAVRNVHPFAHAQSADNLTTGTTSVCAIGGIDKIPGIGSGDPYCLFHNFHTWFDGFTPAITEANGAIVYTGDTAIEWPGISSSALSATRVYVAPHVVPDQPPFVPLIPNVSYQRGSLNWWTVTRLGVTDDTEPCICVRTQVWYYGYFILGTSPDDSSKYRRMRIRGMVWEHESKLPQTEFCAEAPRSLSSNRTSSSTSFIDGYSGGSVCIAPYKFKATLCRAVQDDTATKHAAPWAGGNFYTGTNAWRLATSATPPDWTVNATSYTGPYVIQNIKTFLNSGTEAEPYILAETCGREYQTSFPPGSTATTDNDAYPTVGTITGTHDGSYWVEVAFSSDSFGNNLTKAKFNASGVTILSGPLTMTTGEWSKIESGFDLFQLYASVIEKIADTVSGGAGGFNPPWELAGDAEFPDDEVFEPATECECVDAEDVYALDVECDGVGTSPSGWADLSLVRVEGTCRWEAAGATYSASMVYSGGSWTLTVTRNSDSVVMLSTTWAGTGSDPTGTHSYISGVWDEECGGLAGVIS